MDKNFYISEADKWFSLAEEYINTDICDDGLVLHYLKDASLNYLKALGLEYNLHVENISSLKDIIFELQKKTTIKFPDFINQILDIDDISVSDGCATSICFDIDFYGDIYDAVKELRNFVNKQISL
ncbi:MAG: hypothetical protein GXO21_08325 [Aquificae bacterium]|nr:hypothetical protein [Aquificota bacterium]